MIDYSELIAANVYLRASKVGTLEKLSSSEFIFTYTDEWIALDRGGIGLSMPSSQKVYENNELFPFFDNLIPEGWLLSHAQNIFKIDKKNRFALLLATGRETVGAVTVRALDQERNELDRDKLERIPRKLNTIEVEFLPAGKRCPYCLKELSPIQLKKSYLHQRCTKKMWGTTRKIKINLDPKDPLSSFRQTIYGASISGAQRKGLFHFDGKGLLTPTYDQSQFIIKPQGDYPNLPENEHVTMAIAKAIGFDIPPFTIFYVENMKMVFAIKRFDINLNGEHYRLEDSAQVLEILSEDKYRSSYEKLAKAITRYSDAPIADLFEMWKRLVFSFFIGNGDMHLKNWSFIELDSMKGIFRLSPCYDFLNTRLPLYDEPDDMALALGGQKHKISKKLFVEFAHGLKIEHLMDDVFSNLNEWMTITESLVNDCYLPEEQKERYLQIVRSRYDVLQDRSKKYI